MEPGLSASSKEHFPLDPVRRSKVWRSLLAEGVVDRKPIASYTQEDFGQIDARILLEDMAAQDGLSIDQMFHQWKEERASSKIYNSVEAFMKALRTP